MDIINYPNYIIYKDGQIFNKKKTKFIKNTIHTRKDRKEDYKYYKCTLRNDKVYKHFFVHRLLVQHFKPDEWNPELHVDHIDRNPLNNNLDNLRCVTNLENHQNLSKFKNNTSGVPNISFRKNRNKWRYAKTINNKCFEKTFDTLEEATIFKKKYELENNTFKKKIYNIIYMENENKDIINEECNNDNNDNNENKEFITKTKYEYDKVKHAEYCKNWRKTHKEHLKKYRQKEDYKEYQKNYRKENKEKIAQQKKNWYLKQKEKNNNE